MSLLTRGASMLARVHADNLGESVTYRRGGQSATLTATIGRSVRTQTNQDGSVFSFDTTDFIMPMSVLGFLSSNKAPDRGDTIERIVGSTRITYEVLPTGTEQVYRQSDHGSAVVRVFTKFYKSEAV